MLFLSAFVLIGSIGFAQTEDEGTTTTGTESSIHGTMVSELSRNATVSGKEKGSLISSAARAKALTYANVNARFLRGSAKPANANQHANASANASTNASVNAVNASANASANATANGKPTSLPPVLPPTTGKPVSTPVGQPIGVPVGAAQASIHVGGH